MGAGIPESCREVLYADTQRKIMFLLAPFQGGAHAPQPSIYCGPHGLPFQGRNLCASDFFAPREANSSYKVVNMTAVQRLVQEAKVLDAIDAHTAEVAKRSEERQRAEYLAAFHEAKGSLASLKRFETKYAENDPDGLIAQLSGAKRALTVDEYRKRFSTLKTISEMEQFILDYERDDEEGKVPVVRERLAVARQSEETAAKKATQKKAAEDLARRLDTLERQIIWCKRESEIARSVIDRENQIGRVSGVVNRVVLHQAGETIVVCEKAAPRDFAEYKRLGGVRSYGELQ